MNEWKTIEKMPALKYRLGRIFRYAPRNNLFAPFNTLSSSTPTIRTLHFYQLRVEKEGTLPPKKDIVKRLEHVRELMNVHSEGTPCALCRDYQLIT